MKTKIENEIDFENETKNEFRNENETENEEMIEMNTENTMEMNSGNEPLDPIIEFEATFKKETINGFLDITDEDKDLQFYDKNNQPQWYVPSNPNDMDSQFEWWSDYEYLSQVFQETDIVGLLCDSYEARELNKTIVLEETENDGEIILKITITKA